MPTRVLDRAPPIGAGLHIQMRGTDRLAPMRGLVFGLVLSAILWTVIAKFVY